MRGWKRTTGPEEPESVKVLVPYEGLEDGEVRAGDLSHASVGPL